MMLEGSGDPSIFLTKLLIYKLVLLRALQRLAAELSPYLSSHTRLGLQWLEWLLQRIESCSSDFLSLKGE
jgi:hypothetical protein